MNLLHYCGTSSKINPDDGESSLNKAQVVVIRKQPRTAQGKRDGTAPPLGCPPGLEYLAQMDEMYLNKQYDEPECIESFSSIKFKNPNRYSVENNRGKRKYFAEEESNFCNRISCESYRGFIMHISTNNDTEVIRCERKFKCCAGCCWFADCDNCWWEMTVEAPPGILIGYIRQRGSKWKTHLTLYDANRQKLYDIWSKCCSIFCICCIDDINFYVHDVKSGNLLSPRIYKKWAGWVRDCCTRDDLFVCEFPGMDVKEKALFVCACFMIDVMVFESQKKMNTA